MDRTKGAIEIPEGRPRRGVLYRRDWPGTRGPRHRLLKDMTEHLRTSEPAPLDPAVTVDDRLPQRHRYRQVLAEAIRSRLGDVSGTARVSLRALGRILVQVDVVAPDGARWSLAVPVHEGPEADDVAQIVSAGCALHRVESAQAETRSPPGEAEARSSPATATPGVSSGLIPSEGTSKTA